MTNTKPISRMPTGASLVESIVGIMILVSVLLLIFSCAEIFCAEEYNSQVCRDAARQAAGVCPAPTDRNGPVLAKSPLFRAAQRVVEKSSINRQSEASIFSGLELAEVSLQGLKMQSSEDVEGQISGYVHVKTAMTIKLPVSLGTIIPANLVLFSTYGFPITATTSAVSSSTTTTLLQSKNQINPPASPVQANLYKSYQ